MCWLPTHTTSLPFAVTWHPHRLYAVRWGCVVVCCQLLYSGNVAVYRTLADCTLYAGVFCWSPIVCCQLLYSGSRVAVHLTLTRLYAVRWSMLLVASLYAAGRIIVCCWLLYSGSRVAVHLTVHCTFAYACGHVFVFFRFLYSFNFVAVISSV